jgi:hypothetical protein
VTVLQCVCPPGGIAADRNSGSVYITYSRQNGAADGGVGVARSDDLGLTWQYFSIPGTGSTGSAFDTEWNFQPVKVDALGNVYVHLGRGDQERQRPDPLRGQQGPRPDLEQAGDRFDNHGHERLPDD